MLFRSERHILEEAISGTVISNGLVQYHGIHADIEMTDANVSGALKHLHQINLLRPVEVLTDEPDYQLDCFVYNRPSVVELAKEALSGMADLAKKLLGGGGNGNSER